MRAARRVGYKIAYRGLRSHPNVHRPRPVQSRLLNVIFRVRSHKMDTEALFHTAALAQRPARHDCRANYLAVNCSRHSGGFMMEMDAVIKQNPLCLLYTSDAADE